MLMARVSDIEVKGREDYMSVEQYGHIIGQYANIDGTQYFIISISRGKDKGDIKIWPCGLCKRIYPDEVKAK
jgi:hypothetical protein